MCPILELQVLIRRNSAVNKQSENSAWEEYSGIFSEAQPNGSMWCRRLARFPQRSSDILSVQETCCFSGFWWGYFLAPPRPSTSELVPVLLLLLQPEACSSNAPE